MTHLQIRHTIQRVFFLRAQYSKHPDVANCATKTAVRRFHLCYAVDSEQRRASVVNHNLRKSAYNSSSTVCHNSSTATVPQWRSLSGPWSHAPNPGKLGWGRKTNN